MARKKLVVVCGQSNAGPIGDIQTWEDENPLLALRSPQYSAQRVPQFGQGSYGDLFTMPGTFPGGPTVDNVGALTIGQWQQVDLRGKAMQQVRVLTFANPLPSFVTFNAQTRDYPHTARVVTGSQSGRLQVNLLSQPARAPRTASAIDTATNTITSVGHGFTGNQRVAVTSSELSGVPAGLEARGTYSVTVVDDDNFTLTEWPSGDAVDITSAGSGTINFHEADRGTITRVSTGTTHTACCGGPGTQGSASTSGYTLNVDPPFVPAPREGEQFRYELRSSGQQMSRRLLEFDFAFGGIHDLGGLPTETLVRQPVNPDAPAKFICQREPFYAGRPVQLQQNEQTDLVAFGVLLGIDTSNDTTACSPASANFSDGDAVIYHANGGVAAGGLTSGNQYYIVNKAGPGVGDIFQLAATPGGTPINLTTGGSGVQTLVGIELATDTIQTFTGAAWNNGDLIGYVTNALEITGLTNNTPYYVVEASGNKFKLSATPGGAAVDITAVLDGLSQHTIGSILPAPLQLTTNYYVSRRASTASVDWLCLPAWIDVAADTLTNALQLDSEFYDGEPVKLTPTSGSTLPSPLLASETYYVRVTGSALTIQLARTPDGAAIDIGAVGEGAFAIDRPSMAYTWYLADAPGGEEFSLTQTPGVSPIRVAAQPVFSGSLAGCTVRCTDGSLVGPTKRYPGEVLYDQLRDVSVVRLTADDELPTAAAAGDLWVLEPPQIAGEDIDWKDWAHFLPWTPFEGRADGTVPTPVTIGDGNRDEEGNLEPMFVDPIVQATLGTAFKLYTTGALPRPLKAGVPYFVTAFAGNAVNFSETYGGEPIYPVRITVTSSSNDRVVCATPHGFQQDEPVQFEGDAANLLALGLSASTVYYVDYFDDTEFGLLDAAGGATVAVADIAGEIDVRAKPPATGSATYSQCDQEGRSNPYPPWFAFPNVEDQPQVFQPFAGPLNRARVPRMSPAITLANRIAEHVGEEVYVVPCAFGGTSIGHKEVMPDVYIGNEGLAWLDVKQQLSWAPGEPNNCFARLVDVLAAAKRALAAEGHTGDVVAVHWLQGEEDGSWEQLAARYEDNQARLFAAIRAKIKELDLCEGPAERIRILDGNIGKTDPWPFQDEINAAKDAVAEADPFVRVHRTDDLPILASLTPLTADADTVHHTGRSMSIKADRAFADWQAMERTVRGATELEVANMALRHLGDQGQIMSLFPSDGSRQADLCETYWQTALRHVLEAHSWDFAIRRRPLTLTASTRTDWDYGYRLPRDFLGAVAVYPDGVMADQQIAGEPTSVPFAIEPDANQERILWTRAVDAVLRYRAHVTDPALFSEAFKLALSWHLASLLAPAIMQGNPGIEAATRATQMFQFHLTQATQRDAELTRHDRTRDEHLAEWHRDGI